MSLTVTVVLPTLNRESFLLTTINDLLNQTHKDFKILIVDQSDKIPESIKKIALENPQKIDYHHVTFKGLPIARNYAWQKSTDDIIIYLDDDIRCSTKLVEEHLKSFNNDQIAVVAGGIDEANKQEEKNPKQVGTFSFWTATPRRGFQSHKDTEVRHAPGGNFAVRKKVFSEVGGFDETFSRGAALYEETDFCLRVLQKNYRIIFNPRARVTHLAAATGGCRVPQLSPYIRSLCRNRIFIIRRYLSWYQKPVAGLRLLLLIFSYIRANRQPLAVFSAIKGIGEGIIGPNAPVWSKYNQEKT